MNLFFAPHALVSNGITCRLPQILHHCYSLLNYKTILLCKGSIKMFQYCIKTSYLHNPLLIIKQFMQIQCSRYYILSLLVFKRMI